MLAFRPEPAAPVSTPFIFSDPDLAWPERVDDLVARKRPNGLFDEHAHFFALPVGRLSQKHTATPIVRVLAVGAEVTRTVEFS